MSKIRELLADKNDQIDYNAIIKNYPWIVKQNYNCILSPDSDGLLCGLFLSHYLNWNIVGFYDGKVLVLKDGVSCYDQKTVFIDIEIFRKGVKSMGHHMLLHNVNHKPHKWDMTFKDCIQPNNLRNFDGNKTFRIKYPRATIHMLIGIVGHKHKIEIPESAISALFFTDGMYNVLFKYPENVMNWLNFLDVANKANPLNKVFYNKKNTIHSVMRKMDKFFEKRDEISVPNERGDRLRISNKKGAPYNIEKNSEGYYINLDAKNRVIKFIKMLSELTDWKFKESKWTFERMKKHQFSKSDFKAKKWTVKIGNFEKFMKLNPLSWAMTSSDNIEFTIEKPNRLP